MSPKVLALVKDLFFASKIEETGKQLGISVQIFSDVSALLKWIAEHRSALVILDLNALGVEELDVIRDMRALQSAPRLVGFLSHVQTELAQAATDAGCDAVLPRSQFTKRLPEILQGRL